MGQEIEYRVCGSVYCYWILLGLLSGDLSGCSLREVLTSFPWVWQTYEKTGILVRWEMEGESLLLLEVDSGELAGRSLVGKAAFLISLVLAGLQKSRKICQEGTGAQGMGYSLKQTDVFFRQVSEQWLGGKWLS